jgi:hypothetical protein
MSRSTLRDRLLVDPCDRCGGKGQKPAGQTCQACHGTGSRPRHPYRSPDDNDDRPRATSVPSGGEARSA